MPAVRSGPAPWRILAALEQARDLYGGAHWKRVLVETVARSRFRSAKQVLRAHEVLCFLRAHPDDAEVLRAAEAALARFGDRPDVRRFRAALADTGIAGTDIHYRFFWFTARWLAERWPDRLVIDWPEFANQSELNGLWRVLLPPAERDAHDDVRRSARQWVETLRGPMETDAVFLVRRFAALAADGFTTEMLYERLDPPLVLRGGRRARPGPGDTPGTLNSAPPPSRTRAHLGGLRVVFRTRPLSRARPDLRHALRAKPVAIRPVGERRALALIDLARESMVTRSRDLDSFEHADPRDVRLVDWGEGLQFACIGLVPERRALLDAIHGYLTLQNGVPTGYVLTSALLNSALVAYNVFETFRGAGAADVYGRVLAMVRTLFGAATFAIDPYQLGHDNAEGQKSGAWWFYYKLGFRPLDAATQDRVRRELRRLRKHPGEKSSRATLQALSAAPLFWSPGPMRAAVLGSLPLGNVSLHVARALAERAQGDREAAVDEAIGIATRLLRARPPRASEARRRLGWERWAPLVLVLPGIERWPVGDRRALAAVVEAKYGRRESDFVNAFDRHARLRRAVVQLARTAP